MQAIALTVAQNVAGKLVSQKSRSLFPGVAHHDSGGVSGEMHLVHAALSLVTKELECKALPVSIDWKLALEAARLLIELALSGITVSKLAEGARGRELQLYCHNPSATASSALNAMIVVRIL